MNRSPYRSLDLVDNITPDKFHQITDCLSELADKLRVSGIFLADTSGQVVAKTIRKPLSGDPAALATLTAGSYAAAREIARIAGEQDNFKMVLYEGEKENLFVSAVSESYHLIVLFEKGTAVGMVRLFVKKAAAQLRPMVEGRRESTIKQDGLFNERFQSLLDDELDRSLTEFE